MARPGGQSRRAGGAKFRAELAAILRVALVFNSFRHLILQDLGARARAAEHVRAPGSIDRTSSPGQRKRRQTRVDQGLVAF
jgi:hypothetical protein